MENKLDAVIKEEDTLREFRSLRRPDRIFGGLVFSLSLSLSLSRQ